MRVVGGDEGACDYFGLARENFRGKGVLVADG